MCWQWSLISWISAIRLRASLSLLAQRRNLLSTKDRMKNSPSFLGPKFLTDLHTFQGLQCTLFWFELNHCYIKQILRLIPPKTSLAEIFSMYHIVCICSYFNRRYNHSLYCHQFHITLLQFANQFLSTNKLSTSCSLQVAQARVRRVHERDI